MKFIISIIVTLLLAFSMGLVLPWWSIAIAGFISGLLFAQKIWISFITSFLALFIFWGAMALYISIANDHILAHRISMLVIKKDNPYLLIQITAFLGGITAGISAVTGRLLAIILKKS